MDVHAGTGGCACKDRAACTRDRMVCMQAQEGVHAGAGWFARGDRKLYTQGQKVVHTGTGGCARRDGGHAHRDRKACCACRDRKVCTQGQEGCTRGQEEAYAATGECACRDRKVYMYGQECVHAGTRGCARRNGTVCMQGEEGVSAVTGWCAACSWPWATAPNYFLPSVLSQEKPDTLKRSPILITNLEDS